ncbi:MAG: patatin-like phospholipase family protein [Ferruginibacter sp.]
MPVGKVKYQARGFHTLRLWRIDIYRVAASFTRYNLVLVFSAFILNTIFIAEPSFAQATIQNIVFEGAGIRGIAYPGAIKVLENSNRLSTVKRFGGTSAGAISALLLALGYSSKEMETIIQATPFKKFNDGNIIFFDGASRMKKFYGWYRGKKFENWLAKIIAYKTGDSKVTFSALKTKGFKDLYVTGTCLNTQSKRVFSFENYPDMEVLTAVRISMSIPFYFEAVFINAQGQRILHPANKAGLDCMIDGGVVANFPINIFDSSRYMGLTGINVFTVNPNTVGFRIDRQEQIEADRNAAGLAVYPVENFKSFLGAFYNIILENLNRQTLSPADWQRTISISDGAIGPRIRKISPEVKETLFQNGIKATRKFFSIR